VASEYIGALTAACVKKIASCPNFMQMKILKGCLVRCLGSRSFIKSKGTTLEATVESKMSSNPGVASAKWTPPKGRKSKDQIKRAPKSISGWYLRSILLDGGVECIFITTSSLVEDAFTNQLIVALNNNDPEPSHDEPILTIGLLGAYYMRVSLENPGRLMNIKNGVPGDYQRKAFVRVIDEGEDDQVVRLAALKVVKAFLEEPKNNKYGTKVFIQEPGWDLTVTPLWKLDNYLEYKEIIKIIKDVYSNADGNWAASNLDAALAYFTRGYIPVEAHSDIGIPMEYIGGFFQPPVVNGKILPSGVDDVENASTSVRALAAAAESVVVGAGDAVVVEKPVNQEHVSSKRLKRGRMQMV
jgi:hypothetical protein